MVTTRILAVLSLFVAAAIIDCAPVAMKPSFRPTSKYYLSDKIFDACELREKFAEFAKLNMKNKGKLYTSSSEPTVCEGILGVRCLVGKWLPNAIEFGICRRAVGCVRNRMIQKVKRSCVNLVQLSNLLGASIPPCVKKCPELKNPKFVTENIREENSLDLMDLSTEKNTTKNSTMRRQGM